MKLFYATICLLLMAGSLFGQQVKLPAEIKVAKPGSWFIVAPEIVSGGAARWRVDPGLEEQRLDSLFELPPGFVQKGKIFAGDTGRFKIEVWNAKDNVASDITTCWVVIGAPGPTPVPVPPGPVPPTPDPQPDSAPIAADGYRVLILYETEPPMKLPESEQRIFTAPEIHSYLNTKTAKEPNGNPSYRKWDDDFADDAFVNSPKYMADAYREAVNVKKNDESWIVISNRTKNIGTSEPLPDTVPAVLELLKKYE